MNINTVKIGHEILHYESLPSTNDQARQLAAGGAADGTVVIADTQTAGRGRQGRSWVSPPGQGLWMSVILRPSLKVEDTPLVSLAAAVATQRAIERICGVKAGIKWPNDLVLDGKKLAGILVEMQATKQIKSLILGVGTNLTLKESELPPELAGRTSSLEEACGKTVSREAYLAALLEELDKIYLLLGVGEFPQILEAWRQNSVTLGKQLRVEGPSGLVFGTAMDVDRTGALLVVTEDGQQLKILSGDITVRMADGTYT